MLLSPGEGPAVFLDGYSAGDLWVVKGFKFGMVLTHDVYIGIMGEIFCHPLDKFIGAGDIIRHYQMAKDEPPQGDTLLIGFEHPYLPMNLQNGSGGVFGIVEGLGGVFPRILPFHIFEVGHIDVNDPVQQPQGLQPLVATGVVDQGETEPPEGGCSHGTDNIGDIVGRSHQVDVMASPLLQR